MYKIQESLLRTHTISSRRIRKKIRPIVKRCFSDRGLPIDPRAMPGIRQDGAPTQEAMDSLNERLERQYPMPTLPRDLDTKLGDMKRFHHEGTMEIQEFSHDWVKVSGNTYYHSIIVMPTFVVLWRPRRMHEITADSLLLPTLFHPKIRHVFIGLGTSMRDRPPPIHGLVKRGLSYEYMTTTAAMTCYNNSATSGGTCDMAAAILLPILQEHEKEEILHGFIPKWRIDEMQRLRAGLDDNLDFRVRHRRNDDSNRWKDDDG